MPFIKGDPGREDDGELPWPERNEVGCAPLLSIGDEDAG